MLITKPRFQTFAEYLQYEDNSEESYELFNGELVEMPPESGLNFQIANRLFLVFALMLGTDRVRGHGLELEVRGEPKNRYPDLTIIREEHIQQLKNRNTIRLSMAPPLLVIEVVSPGELQHDRDYIAKRRQYEDLGIPEYWIIDPQTQTVMILILECEVYTEIGIFRGRDKIVSPTFSELNLIAETLFDVGK